MLYILIEFNMDCYEPIIYGMKTIMVDSDRHKLERYIANEQLKREQSLQDVLEYNANYSKVLEDKLKNYSKSEWAAFVKKNNIYRHTKESFISCLNNTYSDMSNWLKDMDYNLPKVYIVPTLEILEVDPLLIKPEFLGGT